MPEQNLLIGPDALAEALKREPPTLIDVRGPDAWHQRHIPGAMPFDIGRLNRREADTAGLLPDTATFNRAAAELGIHNDRPVVVYDERAESPAGRMVWTLQAFGHPAVSLLDGGLQGWLNRGHAVQDGAGARPDNQTAGTFQGEPDPRRIADADHILRGLNRPDMQIIDTRSAAEYRGEDVRARRGGHIPGAVHLDWNTTKAGPDGVWFKDTDTLNALLNETGLDPAKETVCYCQSHQRSALMCVLLESLGFENVKGYPGAWSDWGNRFDTPVEDG